MAIMYNSWGVSSAVSGTRGSSTAANKLTQIASMLFQGHHTTAPTPQASAVPWPGPVHVQGLRPTCSVAGQVVGGFRGWAGAPAVQLDQRRAAPGPGRAKNRPTASRLRRVTRLP